MASKQLPPSEIAIKEFRSADEIDRGIEKLERRLAEIRKIDFAADMQSHTGEAEIAKNNLRDTILEIYGQASPEFQEHRNISFWVQGAPRINPSPTQLLQTRENGRNRVIGIVGGLISRLKEKHQDIVQNPSRAEPPEAASLSDEIFIVHGRDTPAQHEVELLVERAGLKPIVLHRQPNEGRTIIEKFEDHGGSAGFAVVVLTPDDVGGLDTANLQPRARQNVIGEMFWFAGRLGRNRVCALKKGSIEMPSDFAGIGYTEMDDRGAWKAELLRELQAAGYTEIDWGKALS